MMRPPTLLAAIACAALLAGCASRASMDARYQASLQRWQGATRAELESAWGPPRLVQATPEGQVLTWTLRTDIDDRDVRGAGPAVVVTHAPGSGGAGGATATVVNTGGLAPAQVPITCTTRFLLKDGRVASWTFEGLGCGAPN